ncbi:MAG: hypothetical protein U1A72_14215, partial [Sulfuritalea sp.]|nr:hypothetical protein [Sulfuritalea sp.]
ARIGKPVIVSLHPLCSSDNYRFLEHEFGLHIADAGIHLLYPSCAFVVSFGCSTNQFALTFGKSILMYDWFGIRKDERRWWLYRQPDMDVAETMEEFQALLTKWVGCFNWANRSKRQQLPPPSTPLIVDEIANMIR